MRIETPDQKKFPKVFCLGRSQAAAQQDVPLKSCPKWGGSARAVFDMGDTAIELLTVQRF